MNASNRNIDINLNHIVFSFVSLWHWPINLFYCLTIIRPKLRRCPKLDRRLHSSVSGGNHGINYDLRGRAPCTASMALGLVLHRAMSYRLQDWAPGLFTKGGANGNSKSAIISNDQAKNSFTQLNRSATRVVFTPSPLFSVADTYTFIRAERDGGRLRG